MQFKVQKLSFQNAIANADAFCEKKDKGAIISKVLITFDSAGLFVRGTDHIRDSKSFVKVDTEDSGEFCLNGNEVLKGLSLLSDEIITVIVDNKFKITQNKIKLNYQVSEPIDFPMYVMGEMKVVDIDNLALSSALEYVSNYVPSNNLQPWGNCAWVKDGFVVGLSSNMAGLACREVNTGLNILIPKGSISGSDIYLENTVETFKAKLGNGKVPDFQKIIDRVDGFDILFNRVEFLKTLKTVSSFDKIIRMKIIDGVVSLANIQSDNKIDVSFDIKCNTDVDFIFDASLALPFLNHSKENEIVFVFQNSEMPVLLKAGLNRLLINKYTYIGD